MISMKNTVIYNKTEFGTKKLKLQKSKTNCVFSYASSSTLYPRRSLSEQSFELAYYVSSVASRLTSLFLFDEAK